MAILTDKEKDSLRQAIAEKEVTVDWQKSHINAALQAIEDDMQAHKAALSAAIDTATAPYVFSAAVKKRLFSVWCQLKFRQDN